MPREKFDGSQKQSERGIMKNLCVCNTTQHNIILVVVVGAVDLVENS